MSIGDCMFKFDCDYTLNGVFDKFSKEIGNNTNNIDWQNEFVLIDSNNGLITNDIALDSLLKSHVNSNNLKISLKLNKKV